MNKRCYKLSRQLGLGIMLLAAPIFILSLGVLFVQSRSIIHEEVTDAINSTLNTSLNRLCYYMKTIETAANSNVWMLEENFCADSVESIPKRVVQLNGNVVSSSVLVVPDMSREYDPSACDYLEKVIYTKPVISGDACWVDPSEDSVTVGPDEAVATYCRPIRKNDHIVGVLTADLSFSRMADMLNETLPPCKGAYYALLAGDGLYMIHPDSASLFRKNIFTDTDPNVNMDVITVGHEMTAGKQGTVHVLKDGQRYHVAYTPVPDTEWSLVLVCPDSEAMKSFYRLCNLIFVLLVVGLLLIMLLIHQAVKHIIRPIYQLIDTTRQVEDGQFIGALPETNEGGAVGSLQNSFAKMQQALKERIGSQQRQADEIRQHNEELQQKKLQAEDTVRQKAQFIKHVTQQIRIPLNVLTGFADVLGNSNDDEDMVSEDDLVNIRYMMKGSATNMNRLTMLLLDASETDANGALKCSRSEEVSCNKIAKEVVDYAVTRYPNTPIHFETEVDDSMQILTSRIFLLCVLIEPLCNAVSYSDGEHVTLRVSQTDTTVRFTIQDTGPGMPSVMPERVFTPFREIDNLQIVEGIGLPLARRHAAGLGGSLTVDADYHDGCRIIIEMPK